MGKQEFHLKKKKIIKWPPPLGVTSDPNRTIKHVRMVPETHMFETIKHSVPRRKTLTRRATAERWENTIFRPTIYHQAFIDVCVKNYQIIVILEAKTLCKINKIFIFFKLQKITL